MDLNSLDISTASVLQGSAAKSINVVAARVSLLLQLVIECRRPPRPPGKLPTPNVSTERVFVIIEHMMNVHRPVLIFIEDNRTAI